MRDAVVTQAAAPIRSIVASARRMRFVVGAAMSRRSRRPAWHRLGETPRIGRRAATVIGRSEPLQRIARLFEAARHRQAGALVIVGEAGIGKTSLLDHVHAGADGFQRLRVRGVESEAALDHAGLLQLLTPVRHHLDGVPNPQRRALEAAVGWGPRAATDDRFLVAAGTLSLLATAAETAPVVVMVDDLHWLDPGSATAVLFAARRLVHDGVAVLLATRHGSPPGTSLDGLDHLTIDGLDIRDAAALLPPGTAPTVVSRLVEATHGNPLALIETAERLTPAQRRGAAALPDPLPTGGRLEAVYEPVLASLPAASRYAVLLAAASRDSAADPVVVSLRAQHHDPEVALGDAERRGVLLREPGVVRFRHPLLRTAAWATATPAERRAAHAALAAALPDSRWRARIWHLAEAATAPNDALAAELEALADENRSRLGHAAASAALERAARLSDDPALAADRLAAAIEDAALSGDVDKARDLAEQLLNSDADHRARGRALASLGTLEHSTGSVPRAAQLLAEAAGHTDGRLRVRVLAELAIAYHRLGDYQALAAVGDELAAVADRDDPHQRFLSDWVRGATALVRGNHDVGRTLLTQAVDLYQAHPALRDDPRHLLPAVLSTGFLDLPPDRVRLFEDRLVHARTLGALAVLVPVLAMFAYGRSERLGDHTGAFADAGEAVELGTELGFVADVAPAVEMLAWQHAARGVHDDARTELDRAARLVQQAGTAPVAAHLALARAFCAHCRDDLDEVIAVLEPRLDFDEGRGAMGEVLGVAPLLIEAYVALGRTNDAARLADRFAAIPEPDGRTQALIARCRALTADDDTSAVAAFRAALAAHTSASDAPFELARTELLFGARLRRIGQRVAARDHLRRARDRFIAMDLTLWVQRATAELAATGETARPRRRTSEEPLTSQETRVAILVGQGLTNREVAAALFVSPKTVEYHLSNVYRKRGLRSRSELARAMATNPTTT
jgi:DNA-binding NarL/FixJ family response regulator